MQGTRAAFDMGRVVVEASALKIQHQQCTPDADLGSFVLWDVTMKPLDWLWARGLVDSAAISEEVLHAMICTTCRVHINTAVAFWLYRMSARTCMMLNTR